MQDNTHSKPVGYKLKISIKFFLLFFLLQAAMICRAQYEPIPVIQYRMYPGNIKIPALAVLAQHLMMADASLRRRFAEIALAALLDAYEAELMNSSHAKPKTPADASDLVRWRWETSRMIAHLKILITRLLDDAPIALHTNHALRVMIIVDGQPVLVSGPRLDRRKGDLENLIIDSFCTVNDCSWITFPQENAEKDETRQAASKPSLNGNWVFEKDSLPRYRISDNLWFEFEGISDRQKKAEYSHKVADELFRLSDVINNIIQNGKIVDWSSLKTSQTRLGHGQGIRTNTGVTDLKLDLPILSKINPKAWRRVVDWLSLRGTNGNHVLLITQNDLILTESSAE